MEYPRCILASCVVPWDDDRQFLEAPFRKQVATLAANLTRNLYVFGTAGEGYAVDERRFDAVVDVFLDEARRCDAAPMVGLISLSLPTVVERIERCRARGVADFQISLPSWGPLDDDELAIFFRETCGRFPDCRFLHYNLRRAQRLLTPDDYARLAAAHPNLVASKFTSADADTIARLHAQTPQVRYFFGERGYRIGCANGSPGLLASVATIRFEQCRRFFTAGVDRDDRLLGELGAELEQLTRYLRDAIGPGHWIDGAYDKLLWALHAPEFPLRLLPPYRGARQEALTEFRELIVTGLPNWSPDPA